MALRSVCSEGETGERDGGEVGGDGRREKKERKVST